MRRTASTRGCCLRNTKLVDSMTGSVGTTGTGDEIYKDERVTQPPRQIVVQREIFYIHIYLYVNVYSSIVRSYIYRSIYVYTYRVANQHQALHHKQALFGRKYVHLRPPNGRPPQVLLVLQGLVLPTPIHVQHAHKLVVSLPLKSHKIQ
jgi:hypothetical protein